MREAQAVDGVGGGLATAGDSPALRVSLPESVPGASFQATQSLPQHFVMKIFKTCRKLGRTVRRTPTHQPLIDGSQTAACVGITSEVCENPRGGASLQF